MDSGKRFHRQYQPENVNGGLEGTAYTNGMGTAQVSGRYRDAWSFDLRAYWPNGSIGIYESWFNEDGFSVGWTYDFNHPENGRVGYHSLTRHTCQ